ncbi:hypothetical protein Cmaq_0646 [Caldivirga maquilingensis IC-167]|uniref:Uncharacterized protein n=2 Tax=Caldivirga maquilingensis TaxID=76887 RepID=A8MCI0_CALMQ|nr:hypothetical protein Cmaq_0646 [Caldivirga maquilingensis IC-167]
MVKRSIIKYSDFVNDTLNSLMNHEATQESSLRKYRVNDSKVPRGVVNYFKDCGELRQWCISRLRILLSRYRWYDVANLLKAIKVKGLSVIVLMALANDEDDLLNYVSSGSFDKNKVIKILMNELGISGDAAEHLVNGKVIEHKPLRMFRWNFLPRSI